MNPLCISPPQLAMLSYAKSLVSPWIWPAVIAAIISPLMLVASSVASSMAAFMRPLIAPPSFIVFISPLLRVPIISRFFSPLGFKLRKSLSCHKLLWLPVQDKVWGNSHWKAEWQWVVTTRFEQTNSPVRFAMIWIESLATQAKASSRYWIKILHDVILKFSWQRG